jgi:hypothetical protein
MLNNALVAGERPVDVAVNVSPVPSWLPLQPEYVAEPFVATTEVVQPSKVPLLIASFTVAVEDVSELPKESSRVTIGCVTKALGNVLLADPVGC